MSASVVAVAVLLCLLPVSELRGGLPYALARGVPLLPAYLLCVGANALVGPLVYLFLATMHRLLDRFAPYHRLFERVVARTRRRVRAAVERFGPWGLALFVAIPLPITGAYTGALGAWVLGLERRKAFPALVLGVVVAGVVVAGVYALGIKALYIFMRR